MTHRRLLLSLSLPAALFVFCWLTMRTSVTSGSESLLMYGFPLPWHAPSQAGSMARDLALGPLLIDFACYLSSCHAGLLPWAGLQAVTDRTRMRMSVLLWLVAIMSAVLLALRLLSDPQWFWWSIDGYLDNLAVRSRSLHWGLAF